VSRIAYNPPPSAEYWHRDKDAVDEHRTIMERGEMKYSHTYPERYWPNNANTIGDERHEGIRFTYGDLDDVVKLLVMSPMTRQAYLPVWFPEDTGAHHGERVPCSLGYHFLLRENKLDCAYFIRSCDAIRHLRNDIYLTCRLVHWVINECAMRERSPDLLWEEVSPGNLYMWIGSMHCFAAERQGLRRKLEYY
jgi:thymidylate synthase